MTDIILYDHPASICSQMARLVLAEKGVKYSRRTVDIMETHEQFETWYVALNPKAVVPTLQIGDEIVTDTKIIVRRVDELDGPDVSGDATAQGWLDRIMGLHYGVLLYSRRLDPDGTAHQVVARGGLLRHLNETRPDLAELTAARLAGNERFQAILRDPEQIDAHIKTASDLIADLAAAVENSDFIAGSRWSVADGFATAALARFTIHGFAPWWEGTALDDYYARMKARPSFVQAEVIDTGSERDL